MTDPIIVALISGGLALVGVVITVIGGNKKTEHILDKNQAVTDTKIDELTREVREHNNFAQRLPVVEEKIRVINNRLKDLEEYHK